MVAVNKYGEIAGDLFIDMEYIDGEDLSTLIARGPVHPGFRRACRTRAVRNARESERASRPPSEIASLRGYAWGSETAQYPNRSTESGQGTRLRHCQSVDTNTQVHDEFVCQHCVLFARAAGNAEHGYSIRLVVGGCAFVPDDCAPAAVRGADARSGWSAASVLRKLRTRSAVMLPSHCAGSFSRCWREISTPIPDAAEVSEDLTRFQNGQPVAGRSCSVHPSIRQNATVRTHDADSGNRSGDGSAKSAHHGVPALVSAASQKRSPAPLG